MRKTGLLSLCLLLAACALLSSAEAHESHDGDHAHEDEVAVRCRFCGAKAALKKDYTELHDTSKSISSKHEVALGENGELHTFVNPNRVEMDLAGFTKSNGIESDAFTTSATFFEDYNWRDVRCSSCKRHIGWSFRHNDVQQCVNTRVMESISSRAQENLLASTSEKDRKEAIVQEALESTCIEASAGWWTYEICYKKEVRQFHEETDGKRSSEWSMGVYVPEEQTTDTPYSGTDIIQYFAGGQHCDENGELRRSKVLYTCCPKSESKLPSVEKVEEPALCSYAITVCIPDLCETAPEETAQSREQEKYIKACEKEFKETHKDEQLPPSFCTLRWATVIAEDSSELQWARKMQFKA